MNETTHRKRVTKLEQHIASLELQIDELNRQFQDRYGGGADWQFPDNAEGRKGLTVLLCHRADLDTTREKLIGLIEKRLGISPQVAMLLRRIALDNRPL
jgi:hypothetical protein